MSQGYFGILEQALYHINYPNLSAKLLISFVVPFQRAMGPRPEVDFVAGFKEVFLIS